MSREIKPKSFTRFISGRESAALENKIFNTASFVFFLVSVIVAIGAIITQTSSSLSLTFFGYSVVFLCFFYFSRFRQRFLTTRRIFLLITLVFVDIAWFWAVTSTSSVNYLFILILILGLTILSVKDHLGFVIVSILNLLVVDLLAFSQSDLLNNLEPGVTVSFPYRDHEYLIGLIILLSIVIAFFKKNYEKERQLAADRSRQLVNANRALNNRNQHLESMARMVSHNLRSPMAGLKMLMHIYDEVPTDKEKQELMDNFKEGAQTLFNMVDDLSEVMMDYRELVKERETIELSDTLATVTAQLSTQIKKEKAVIKSDFSEVPKVEYSRYFLDSIFLNLISNALKYRSPDRNPVIEIRSYKEGDKVMLSFKDNGIGIDLGQHREKIFKMYKTFHNNIETDSKGIGLFITKNQVETLGGKIDVDSKPEIGTTFFIELYRQ